MTTLTQVITAETVERLEAQDIIREVAHGQWVEVEVTGERHGIIAGNILVHLKLFAREHKLGRVYPADVTFVLEGDPQNIITMRLPDVSFVSAARVKTEERDKYYYQAPDLAVEVISPSEKKKDIEEKLADYLRTGVQEVWQVYPDEQQVRVYTPAGTVTTYTLDQTLTTPLLPDFVLSIKDIFEDA